GAALRRCAVTATARAGPRVHCYSHGSHETDEEFDARWVTYFNKPDTDAWELRKAMNNTLVSYDMVPEPKIIDVALWACRRLNGFASAVRILEGDLLILLLECKQLPGNTDNILPYLNKFSFIKYQAM
uniref:Cytochrome c oxidase subunit 5A, mitochondrial n=1 Tax=Colobus angolensis palliatus TaxID=336983 RepID=A0A2K5JBD1_COLAP